MKAEIETLRLKIKSQKLDSRRREGCDATVQRALLRSYKRHIERDTLAEARSKSKPEVVNHKASMDGEASDDCHRLKLQNKELKPENRVIRESSKAEVKRKNDRIAALEQTLHAQELVLDEMKEDFELLREGIETGESKAKK